jgi:hypothetical protein
MSDKLKSESGAVRTTIYKGLGAKKKVGTKKSNVSVATVTKDVKAVETVKAVEVAVVEKPKRKSASKLERAAKRAKIFEETTAKQVKSSGELATESTKPLGEILSGIAKLSIEAREAVDKKGDSVTAYKEKESAGADIGRKHEEKSVRSDGKEPEDRGESSEDDPWGVKKFVDIRTWVKSRWHELSPANASAITALRGMGIKVEANDKETLRMHPISRVCRDEAVATMLAREGKGRRGMVVLDWYGSDRNKKFTTDVMKDGVMVCFYNCPKGEIRGDAGRSGTRLDFPETDDICDVGLIQDVYYGGLNGRGQSIEVTPHIIYSVAKQTRLKTCYVMFRPFVGTAGTDPCYPDCDVEGAWYRDEIGMINFSPERGGVLYPPHPDVNWLLKRSTDGPWSMDIQDVRTIGPYRLVSCTLREEAGGARDIGTDFPIVTAFNPPPRIMSGLGRFLAKRVSKALDKVVPTGVRGYVYSYEAPQLMEHIGIKNMLLNISYRPSNGYLIDSAAVGVKKEMEKDPSMAAIAERFPQIYPLILEGTLLSVLYSDRVVRAKRAMDQRDYHRESESILKRVRDPMVLDYVPSSMSMITCAALGYGVLCNQWTFPYTKRIVRAGFGLIYSSFVPSTMSVLDAITESPLVGDLVTFAPVGACVLFEEAVRAAHPLSGVGLGLVEFSIRCYRFGYSGRWLPPLLGHLSLSYLQHVRGWSVLSCVVVHLLYNYFCHWGTRATHRYLWNDFKQRHSRGELIPATGSFSVPIPAGDVMTPLQNRVMEWKNEIRGKMDIKVNGITMTPSEALQVLDGEEPAKNMMWPVLITNRVLWEPAKTSKNLLLALLSRIHKIPKYHVEDKEIRRKAWRQTYGLLDRSKLLDTPVFLNTSFLEATKLMGSRGKRLVQANTREIEEGASRYVKAQSLKWNETITALKLVGGVITLKPRAITQLDPKGLAHCTPWSRDLADAEKKHIFKRNPIVLPNGLIVYLIYASGCDQEMLDDIAEFCAACEEVVVVASGDDSFVTFGKYAQFFGAYGAEGDLSMADQSQDEACFDEYQFKVIKRLGVPRTIREITRQQCVAPYRVDKDGLIVEGSPGCQLPTGATWTSFFNTNTVLGAYLYYFSKCNLRGKPPVPEEVFAELGLELKFQYSSRLSLMTFLKGWFKIDENGKWHWMPLPSQVLKIAKTLRDPVLLMKVTRKGRTVRFSPTESIKQYAHLIYTGHANIEKEYPVLGEFLDTLKRLGSAPRTASDVVESEKFNRIKFGKFDKLNQIMVEEDMEERYGIDAEDLVRVNGLLRSVSSLPSLLVDPVFDKLCDVDYPGDVMEFEPMSLLDALWGGGPIVRKTMAGKRKAKRKTVRMVAPPMMVVEKKKKKNSKRKRSRRSGAGKKGGLTPDGSAFLKVVTSPCDFVPGGSGFRGIPDEFDNRVIVDENSAVNGLPAYTIGKDLYIIQPPIPGVAYLWGEVPAGSRGVTLISFTPVYYPDATTLFPNTGFVSQQKVVDRFRMAANAIELVNVTNENIWSGSIEAYKLELDYGYAQDTVTDATAHAVAFEMPVVNGLDGLFSSEPGYVGSIKDGVYMTAFNLEVDYPMRDIRMISGFSGLSTDMSFLNANCQASNTRFINVGIDMVVGWGTLETNVIRIPAAAASQAMRIRTWQTVEYTVPSTSLLYSFSHLSPPSDPAAMALLKAIHHHFPMAVTAAQNATFWENVRKWAGRLTKLGSYIPGPIGAVSHLINDMVVSGDVGFSLD